jgi:hypothetical protein
MKPLICARRWYMLVFVKSLPVRSEHRRALCIKI